MPGEGAASKTGGDGSVGLVEEVLLTRGDWRLDLGSGLETEVVGLGDGGNAEPWSEREVEKAWFGGRWCNQVELCCL